MSSSYYLISNNPRIRTLPRCIYVEGSILDVLVAARDKVHVGYKILSHPLSGNISPSMRIFMTIILAQSPCEGHFTDIESLNVIESTLEFCKDQSLSSIKLDQKVLEDMQYLDEQLIMPVLCRYGIVSKQEVCLIDRGN